MASSDPTPPDQPPPSWWGATAERAATWTFVVLVVAAAVTIRWLARDQWFQTDEWAFLADRHATSGNDLFRSWNQHWVTIPLLAYRAIWQVVGLHHYWPYQLLAIASHLAVGCLLRVMMRRAGVHPWIATGAATAFLFYGSGRDNLVNGFQVAFNATLALGLAHLLLADHDGPLGRRDLLGLACGLGALMCSGIAIPMIAVVGLATLVRRGWVIALGHTVPLLAIFGLWWSRYRGEAADQLPTVSIRQYLDYAFDLATSPISRLGQVRGVGLALAAAALLGAALAVRAAGLDGARRRYAAVGSAVAGAFLIGLFVARGRAGLVFGPPATSERYTHLAAALLVPFLAVGISELARRWRPLLLPGVALFLIGVPGNIDRLTPVDTQLFTFGGPHLVLSVAEAAPTSGAPDQSHPLSIDAPLVTTGWLREGRASGRIPDAPADTPPAVRARGRFAVTVLPVDGVGDRTCTGTAGTRIELDRGERLRIGEPSAVVSELDTVVPPPAQQFFGADDTIHLEAFDGPVVVQVDPPGRVERCR